MTDIAELGLSIRSDGVVVATDRLKDFEGAGRRAEGVSGSLARAAVTLGVALAGAFSIRAISQYADAWSDMQSRVGAAVKDMEAAPALMQRMVDLANSSYSPLEQTVEVYTRNVGVLRDLGVSAAGAADFTESLNHMLVITATRGERAASVQNALSKAMAVGKLQADGLETVLANGGRVAEALATELGTTVSGLRGMAAEGKITGDVIAGALLGSLEDVREEAAEMPATIADAFTRIQTNTTALVGTLDQAWGISGMVAEQMLGMADSIRGAADTMLRLGEIAGMIVGPAFSLVLANMELVGSVAQIAVAALTGFFAPAILSGLAALAVAIGTGVVGAIQAVTAAMMANPLGLLVAGIAAAVTAAYVFRDEIRQAIGIDVVAVAKGTANNFIGLFAGAYQAVVAGWDLLPAAFSDIFTRAMNGAIDIVQNGVNGIIGALKVIPGLGGLENADLSGFKREESGASQGFMGAVQGAFMSGFSNDYIGQLATGLSDIWTNADGASEAVGGLTAQLGMGEGIGAEGGGGGLAGAAGAANDNLKAANDNIWGMTEALGQLGAATVDPLTQVANQLRDLDSLLAQGKISWDQYGEAAYRANAGAASAVFGLASGMTGALSQMFQDNKAFAVANAVVSTAEAVMKALSIYGPTPWGFAAAGVAAATGAAQIATIFSAQKGSSSVSKPGGGGAMAGAAERPATEANRATEINLTLGGAGRYSREEVRDLIEQFTEGLNDGVDGGKFKLAVNS